MKVLYVCDDNYSYIAGVSILSLIDAHKAAPETIEIYLVNDGISDDNIDKLKSICNCPKVVLEILDFSKIERYIEGEVHRSKWGKNVFARLFPCRLFENNDDIDRIIYLDCDTLINDSLLELWNVNLSQNIAAAVNEAMGSLHKRAIGLNSVQPYFNSGVILINVKKWKEQRIESQINDFLRKAKELEYPDEAALNNVLQDKILLLPPKYNSTSLTFYFTGKELKRYRKSKINYTEAERQEALKNPIVIHFTSTFRDARPWVENCQHIYSEKWKYYKSISPWKNLPLRKDESSIAKKFMKGLVDILPFKLGINIAGFVHAYIKPIPYFLHKTI